MDSVICMIIEIVAILVLFLVFDIVLPTYATKKGENRAEIEDARRITYEQKRGRNLATKDDIDTVIKELEKVKSEVSLIEQRKHNLIEKRNENLFGIVEAAERIRIMIMKIRLACLIKGGDSLNPACINGKIEDLKVHTINLHKLTL